MYTSKKVGKMYYLSVIASFLVVITLTMALNITGLNPKLIDHYEEAGPKPIKIPRIQPPNTASKYIPTPPSNVLR